MRAINDNKFEILVSAKLDSKSADKIQSQLNRVTKGVKIKVQTDDSEVNKLKNSVNDLGNAAKKNKGQLQGLRDIVGKFSGWQIVGDVIHSVKDAMQDMVQQVFDLDQSLVELSKVSDLSGSALDSFADQAFAVGEKIGATGKDVIDATTIFAQAGYEAKDALDLGEQAIMLKNVSEAGATAEGSANTLIATLKAFNLEAGDSNHIVNALNEVSNKYAVSVNDLATAMTKSSASMAAGNNTLEQTFGLVTAGTEILREPGRVANGLSTITARLTAEQDNYIASITGGMGVIDKNTGELRSTYDILKDLSEAWEGLTSVEKQELAETVAGKTQRSLFTALMTNFSSAIGATEAALNSENSASIENEKRMDSLQGKVQQLQSAWQSFSRNTLNSEVIKSLLSLGTTLLKLADSDIGRVIIAVTGVTAALTLFTKAISLEKIVNFAGNFLTLRKAMIATMGTFKEAAVTTNVFNASLQAAGAGVTIFFASLLTNPLFYITAGLTAVTIILQKFREESEKASEAQKNIAQQNRDEATELSTLSKTYEELSNKKNKSKEDNEKLSQTIDSLSTKYGISKSALMSEGQERDNAIKKINDEITARKQAAALATESSLKVGRSKDKDITKEEQGLLASRESVSAADAVKGSTAKRYDLEAASIDALQKKIQGYITTLQNKNALSKEEENDLKNLSVLYSDLSSKTGTLKEAYAQANANFKEGIPITTDEANALYQLGYITNDQAIAIQAYNEQVANRNDLSEEQKQHIYDTMVAQGELNAATEDASTLADQYNQALEGNINQMINYEDNMDILRTAQEEIANAGSITAETFNQITQNGLIDYLDVVNGQLQVNADAMANSTDTIKENAIANLQAATYEQIREAVLEDVSSQQQQVSNTAANAQGAVSGLGQNAITMGQNMLAAAGDVAKLNEELRQIPGVSQDYTPSEETGKKIQEILDKAGKTKAFIESWKPSTSKGARKSSGGGSSRRRSSGGSSGGGRRSSGTGTRSTAQKSAQETYKAEVDALYEYKNALDIAKDSVDKLNDALKNTDNFNEQEKYLRQLIDATNDQINKTNELKNAQVGQIESNISQLRAQGFAIDYNASKNELYIRNMQHLGDFTGDAAKKVEKLIDKTEDLNKNNRTLDGSVRDLRKDTKDYYDQLAEIPEKKLKKFNDLMKDFQQGRLDQIQNQIDDIQHELKNDPRLKQLEKQIEALEKQNDELDGQKEIEEKLLAVEQAKEKIANQRRQKNIQVYREGQGWVWEADVDAIQEAAEELKTAQDDLNDKIKQDQIDQLQAEKDALEKSYQDRIDALQNFLDEQNYLIDKANRTGIETFQKLQNELAKFGLNSAEYLGKASEWLNNYNKSLLDLNKTVSNILSSSNVATNGLVYSPNVQNRINQALSGTIPVVNPTGLSLSQVDYDKLSDNNDKQNIYINNIELPNVKDVDDFIEALKDLPRMATAKSTQRK